MDKIISWAVVAICAVMAIAWKFDIRQIIQVNPTYPAMQINTTICLSLVALSFIFKKNWLLILPCILSIVTLFEYATGINTNVGTLFMTPDFVFMDQFPGQMGMLTCFSILMFAMGHISTTGRNIYIPILSLSTTFAIGFSLLIVYSSNLLLNNIYLGINITYVALPTAVCIFLLSISKLIETLKIKEKNHLAPLWLTYFFFASGVCSVFLIYLVLRSDDKLGNVRYTFTFLGLASVFINTAILYFAGRVWYLVNDKVNELKEQMSHLKLIDDDLENALKDLVITKELEEHDNQNRLKDEN